MGNLFTRLRQMGLVIIVGICLIVYVALGFIYFQQGPKQKDLAEQITKTSIIVAKPLPGAAKLQAEYDAVNEALAPLPVPDVLDKIVGIARESGIDVVPGSGKFNIPPLGSPASRQIGGTSYQVLTINGIRAQADYEDIKAFISDLDSGVTMETLALKRVSYSWTEVSYEGEEAARRAEFREVISAVTALMDGSALTEIPNPMSYDTGDATNYMGDDPDTEDVMEGFPDITTTAAEKGYSGNAAPMDGYLLYQHDKISTDNTTQFETVDYMSALTTGYYYTCEPDGTVRQFDGPNMSTATEYLSSEPTKIETVVNLDVELYTKPLEGD